MTNTFALSRLALLGALSGIGAVCLFRRNAVPAGIVGIVLTSLSAATLVTVFGALLLPLVGLLP